MVSRVINTMVTNPKRNDLSRFRPTMSSSYKLLKVSLLLYVDMDVKFMIF